MEKLNIGLFIDTFFPMIDGVIMVVDNYAKRLNKIANITVFCPKPNDKKYNGKFEYKVVRSKKIKFYHYDYNLGIPNLDKNFKKALNQSHLDIVHIHSPFSIGKIGVKYAKKHNIPCVATLHSQFKKDFYKATHSKILTKILLRKIMKVFNACDECWAVNEEIKKLFIEEYKLTAPCTVQLNGTDMLPVENKEQAIEEINKKYNIDANEKVFLFVGRLVVLKNILFIVDALKVLKDKGFKFKMLYCGSGPDENELRNKIKKNGLEEEVTLCGRIEDRITMSKIFNRADLFLFPSLYDANSLVQIEASSQKTPTLFLRGARTAGTVTEDVNGFIGENDANKYAQKIIDIFNDEKHYNEVCENAFNQLYITWDKTVEKAYNDYLNLINNKKIQNNK